MWRQSTILHSRHTVWSESHCFLRIFPVMETKNKSKNWFHISTITEYSVVANVHSKKNRFHCLYIIRSVYTYRRVRIGKKLAQTVFLFQFIQTICLFWFRMNNQIKRSLTIHKLVCILIMLALKLLLIFLFYCFAVAVFFFSLFHLHSFYSSQKQFQWILMNVCMETHQWHCQSMYYRIRKCSSH